MYPFFKTLRKRTFLTNFAAIHILIPKIAQVLGLLAVKNFYQIKFTPSQIYLHLVVTNFLDFFCGCHQQYLQNPRFEFSWDFETHFVTKLWIQELFSENQLLLCIPQVLLYLGLEDVFLKTVAIHLGFQQT